MKRQEQPLKVTCHFAPPGPEADRAWQALVRWVRENVPVDPDVVNDPEVQAIVEEWARALCKGERRGPDVFSRLLAATRAAHARKDANR